MTWQFYKVLATTTFSDPMWLSYSRSWCSLDRRKDGRVKGRAGRLVLRIDGKDIQPGLYTLGLQQGYTTVGLGWGVKWKGSMNPVPKVVLLRSPDSADVTLRYSLLTFIIYIMNVFLLSQLTPQYRCCWDWSQLYFGQLYFHSYVSTEQHNESWDIYLLYTSLLQCRAWCPRVHDHSSPSISLLLFLLMRSRIMTFTTAFVFIWSWIRFVIAYSKRRSRHRISKLNSPFSLPPSKFRSKIWINWVLYFIL